MTRLQLPCAMTAIGVVLLCAACAGAVDVSINGVVVPRATSTMEGTQDITEFRAGGDPTVFLLPGSKRYRVCVIASAPVAVLDAELPPGDTPDRFTVQIEDGRQLGRCLLASLATEGSGNKRKLTYCLKCESVTTP